MAPMTLQAAFDLALAHHQGGRLQEAEAIYRQILAMEPGHADALHLLGVIAHQGGRSDVAVEMILNAIAIAPGNPAFHSNLGEAYRKLDRLDEAIAAYRRALQLNPNQAEAHYNLGAALEGRGQPDEAIAAYRRAVQLTPDYAEAHNNLGNALGAQGQLDESIAACERALRCRPDYAQAHNNLGASLADLGRFEEAIAAYRRALQFWPEYAEAHSNLGVALNERGYLGEAVAAHGRAVQLRPDYAEAHSNLGVALTNQGRLDESIAAYRRALQIKPDYAAAHGNLLLGLHYLPDAESELIFCEHGRWAAVHAAKFGNRIGPHGNGRDPERRLRIGYVSQDFREHPVAYFLEGLLAAHDRSKVEVYGYADVLLEDEFTRRFRQHAGQWRKIAGMRDEQVAALISEDQIDILVDVAGHTARNRLLVFARRAAPVQVTWLGYPDTTGMPAMDYRLTDAHADPPGTTERFHSERLVRLPDCAWCYHPRGDAPPVSDPPSVQTGHVTFGCFNAQQKINEPLVALWARILAAMPGSRLLLKNRSLADPDVQVRMKVLFEKSGIAPERVEMAGPIPGSAGHLAAYGRVDIALDTFPYHGTTTTCEALWMGVTVITLAGKTHVSRVGVSLLNNAGLPELVAETPDEYVQKAAGLAADVVRLAGLRATLRERMKRSPLMDAPRFARNIEEAYRQMWRAWCANECSNLQP